MDLSWRSIRAGLPTERQLTAITAGWPAWSRHSRWIIFQNDISYLVRVTDGKVQRIGTQKQLKSADWTVGWPGVTPEGGLISTKDAGSTEIYSLDWDTGH